MRKDSVTEDTADLKINGLEIPREQPSPRRPRFSGMPESVAEGNEDEAGEEPEKNTGSGGDGEKEEK